MATRNLQSNSKKADAVGQKIFRFTSRELEASYRAALVDVRAEITRLYELYMEAGELTKAQSARFLLRSNIEAEIVRIMEPVITANTELLKEASAVTFDQAFYQTAWAVDQATGVKIGWGILSENAVRAACGIGGNPEDLLGLMPDSEVTKHMKVMDKAFTNYGKDTRRWIQNDIRQGVIKGESIPQITKRLKNGGMLHSFNSAELIARTETLRSTGLGSQITYEEARDNGVNIVEVWDATLDGRTRPEHGEADGTVKDNATGMFSVPWGDVPGPRRSGIAGQDIQCRCDVNPQIEGYAPEVRRIRDEGIQPYTTFKDWAQEKGLTANRFGQKYNF